MVQDYDPESEFVVVLLKPGRNSTYRLRALPGAIEDLEQVSQATDLLDPLREQVNWGTSYLWDRETALAQATVRDMRHLRRVAEF